MKYLSVHGDAFKIKMGLTKHRPCWGLIDTSGFDSYKTILHNINAPNTIRTFRGNVKKR